MRLFAEQWLSPGHSRPRDEQSVDGGLSGRSGPIKATEWKTLVACESRLPSNVTYGDTPGVGALLQVRGSEGQRVCTWDVGYVGGQTWFAPGLVAWLVGNYCASLDCSECVDVQEGRKEGQESKPRLMLRDITSLRALRDNASPPPSAGMRHMLPHPNHAPSRPAPAVVSPSPPRPIRLASRTALRLAVPKPSTPPCCAVAPSHGLRASPRTEPARK